jgi:BirA family biotin operon repressor/biotin-[acetyl-CoA-carboxylase] ligase
MKSTLNTPQEPGSLTFTLLHLLADGEFHSGEVLAQQLSISRASVNNALRGIEHFGLTLFSVRGRGYRLSHPLQLLNAQCIEELMGERGKDFKIEILNTGTSSNTLLLQRAKQDIESNLAPPSGSVLALEWQSSGRGRLGRTWHAGLGNSLTFSLLWRFDCGLSALSGLSLAVGVGLIRAFHVLGIQDVQLKWPNDVLGEQGKLAGILIEAQGDMLGPSTVVMGVGINLDLQKSITQRVDQPITSLSDTLGDSSLVPERNLLFATILVELGNVLQEFAKQGFAAFREEWQAYHGFQNQWVQLLLPDGSTVSGVVRSVANDGALELEIEQQLRRFNVGEVSLRGLSHVTD